MWENADQKISEYGNFLRSGNERDTVNMIRILPVVLFVKSANYY